MILGFSTKFPKGKGKLSGNKTHFVEKIWESIFKNAQWIKLDEFLEYGKNSLPENYKINTHKPKLHTMRSDEKNRWKVGMDIHFKIWEGIPYKSKMIQFAPVMKVKSIQKIEITYDEDICEKYCSEPAIFIDNKPLNIFQVQDLAVNDGFADESEFCHWFNEDFTGKIIHWTRLKY